MWKYFAIIITALILGSYSAVTPQNEITRNFQLAVHRQDLHSILFSIEERLRNLDNIYTMHLSPTLEDKLDQYQRKLEALDKKLIRLETLMMLNLDKIAENISNKNFKDDVAYTNLIKKIDTLYEGSSYRLNYIERKIDTAYVKIQTKIDATSTKLEKMDEAIARRNEDLEIGVSDAIAAIDDLKSTNSMMEENILNNTNENFEVSFKEQMQLVQTYNDRTTKALQKLYENATSDFDRFNEKLEEGFQAINETNRFLKALKTEVKTELNEYAVKVAEMNSENWKTGGELKAQQTLLEKIINTTRMEVENTVRGLMIQMGKIHKLPPQNEQSDLKLLSKKLDSNFEKVFSTQNLFLDSCYRLQMDESQIESRISTILEKLIDTFEQKNGVESKGIKSLEKLIKTHDAHITRNLHKANANIVEIYEKLNKGYKDFELDIKQIIIHLNSLLSLTQAKETGGSPAQALIEEIEKKLDYLQKQGAALSNSMGKLTDIMEGFHQNSTQYFRNISGIVTGIQSKVNRSYLDQDWDKDDFLEVDRDSNSVRALNRDNFTDVGPTL